MSGCSLTLPCTVWLTQSRFAACYWKRTSDKQTGPWKELHAQRIQTTPPMRHHSSMGRCHLMSKKCTAKCFDSFQQVQMFEPTQVKTFCSDSNIFKLSNVAVFCDCKGNGVFPWRINSTGNLMPRKLRQLKGLIEAPLLFHTGHIFTGGVSCRTHRHAWGSLFSHAVDMSANKITRDLCRSIWEAL